MTTNYEDNTMKALRELLEAVNYANLDEEVHKMKTDDGCSPIIQARVVLGLEADPFGTYAEKDDTLKVLLEEEQTSRTQEAQGAEARLVLEGQRLLQRVVVHMYGYHLGVVHLQWERDHIVDEARLLAVGHDLKRMAALLQTTGGYLSGTSGDHDLQVEKHQFWTEVKERCQWDHHADRYWISGEVELFEYLTGGEEPS